MRIGQDVKIMHYNALLKYYGFNFLCSITYTKIEHTVCPRSIHIEHEHECVPYSMLTVMRQIL